MAHSKSDETSSYHDTSESVISTHVLVNFPPSEEHSSASPRVSDNRGIENTAIPSAALQTERSIQVQTTENTPQDPFHSTPMDPWHLTFTEVKAMRATTESFSTQLLAAVSRTSTWEGSVDGHSTRITKLEQEVKILQNTVEEQRQMISDAKTVKEEFSNKSAKIIAEMNGLLEKQKGQVKDFKSSARKIRAEASKEAGKEAERQVSEFSKNIKYNTLKKEAFQDRFNLVIIGLTEQASLSAYAEAKNFFKSELKLSNLNIQAAHRLGLPPLEPIHVHSW